MTDIVAGGAHQVPVMTRSQASMVVESLRVSLDAAARHASAEEAAALLSAASTLDVSPPVAPHPSWPVPGTAVTRVLEVTEEDTAAAMGHPDTSITVLGSPRISLWCELVSAEALPPAEPGFTHVGVGILVHHLGRADVGERVTVTCTLASVSGRRGVFECVLTVGDRLVALATHHRVVVPGV